MLRRNYAIRTAADLAVLLIVRGESGFEVIACIDGRGFGIRREDIRRLLVALEGKVFTLATLKDLVVSTGLARFVS